MVASAKECSTHTTIRHARPTDAVALAEINVESWRATYSSFMSASFLANLDKTASLRRWLKRIENHESSILIAEQNGEVVGFVSYGQPNDADAHSATVEAYSLYIRLDKIGSGVGFKLGTAVLRDMKSQGYRWCNLWVFNENLRARRLYEKMGFVDDNKQELRNCGGDAIPAMRYKLDLAKVS